MLAVDVDDKDRLQLSNKHWFLLVVKIIFIAWMKSLGIRVLLSKR
jgi:hypothetical protein